MSMTPEDMQSLEHIALTQRAVTIPEVMLIAGTRVALGIGLGLLLSDRLNEDQRKAAGWALFGGRCHDDDPDNERLACETTYV